MNITLRRHAKPRVTAAEMYQVQDSYVRFNQKDHMGSQMVWDAQVKAQRDKLKVKQRKLTEKGRAGFEATAWSLDAAADSLLSLMDFSKNQADAPATAWQSKVEPAPTGRPKTSRKLICSERTKLALPNWTAAGCTPITSIRRRKRNTQSSSPMNPVTNSTTNPFVLKMGHG